MDIPSAESDAWNVAEGTAEGKPTLLRYRPSLQQFLGDARYPKILSIDWSYEETNDSGMPNEAQIDEMGRFENALQSCLDADRLAVLAFVQTSAGVRTLYYYVRDDIAEIGQRINEVLEPGLPIHLEVADDPEWQELREIYDMCGEAP